MRWAQRLLGRLRRLGAGDQATTANGAPSSVWDHPGGRYACGGFKTYWETLEPVSRYQARLMTGGESDDVLAWAAEAIRARVGASGLRGLSLGCAEAAAPEVFFARSGLFRAIDVVDLAAGLLERRRAAAAELGCAQVRYLQADLERIRLEPSSYDVVWAIGTVHHVERLETLFRQVNEALSDRGLVLLREYVGPDRLQFGAAQLEHADRVLSGLPEDLRRRWDGTLKTRTERADLARLLVEDPTEAVRSSHILRVADSELAVERVIPTGGSLLMPLLEGIAGRFEGSPEAGAALDQLIRTEQELIASGRLDSDFVLLIAGKRARSAPGV